MKTRTVQKIFLLSVLSLLQIPCLLNAKTTEESTVTLERSGARVKLVGTAVASNSENSIAVVEVEGRYQIYLREGDVVDNALVKKILRDRVIVDTGSGEESVMLRQSLSTGTKIRPEAAQPLIPSKSFGPRPPEGRNLKVVYLDRESKKSLIGNIDGVLKEVRINPVRLYGKTTGIRIYPIEPGSVFSEMGLKYNDVIREVNGKSVTVPEDVVAFFQRMKKGGEFDVKVKGRRTRQIHIIVE
jgi:type II secretion system protein C